MPSPRSITLILTRSRRLLLEPDPDRSPVPAIFQRVDEKVGQQLAELERVAADQSRARLVLDADSAALRERAKRGLHLLDQGDELDRVARQGEALRLDPGQRHEVVEQVAHPRRLAEHDRDEALPGRRVHGLLVLQGFEETQQGSERCSKLVRGIGDEIDAHLLGGALLALVGETDQPAAVGQRRDAQLPGAAELAEAHQFDPDRLVAAVAGQMFGRGRMADGEADVGADDMIAEQRPRRLVGDRRRGGRARAAAAPRTPRTDRPRQAPLSPPPCPCRSLFPRATSQAGTALPFRSPSAALYAY